jgi:hypothetical protein
MRGKSVKEEYGGEGGLQEDHSTRDWGDGFLGLSGICREELSFGVGLDQYNHRFAGGFGHEGQDIHMISWS